MYSIIFRQLFTWRLEIIRVRKKYALRDTNYSDSYLIVIRHMLRILSKLSTLCTAFCHTCKKDK